MIPRVSSARSLASQSATLLVAGAFTALTAMTACSSSSAKPRPPTISTSVAHVERRTIGSYESLDGQVDPFLSANLAPQQSGTLVAIYANEGDRVTKGETLAKIDDSLLRATLTQNQGLDVQNVAKLQQSKIQLPITTVTNESALVQAQRALEQQKKTQIADAANVRNTKLTYDADGQLLHQGYVAESVYQQARATYVAAQQTLEADNDKLVQDIAAVRTAQQNLANTPLQKQVIAENQGAVVQSSGDVAQSQTAVKQATIVAPFDGVVTSRTLDPGSYAGPSQAIYSIAQIDPIYVDFNVKDTDLAFVHPGTPVSFATSANPGRRYDGTIASIDSVPQTGTLLYRARIIERNPDFSLRGGLQVSVRITTALHKDTLTVPRAAVVQSGTSGTLYSVEGDGSETKAKLRNVHLGLQTTEYVEVSGGGVHAGMPIVLNQTDNLHDGVALAVPTSSPSSH
jgi:RND family efflux transporter MFP subunit